MIISLNFPFNFITEYIFLKNVSYIILNKLRKLCVTLNINEYLQIK